MPIRTAPWPTGTPCWVDLAVPDVDAATEFYAAILGWTYADTGEEFGHYQMCQRKGDPLGGIGGLDDSPPGAPPHWMIYFMVADSDITVAAATERGAMVPAGPLDTPSGRMAVITDPQGATFAIMSAVPSG